MEVEPIQPQVTHQKPKIKVPRYKSYLKIMLIVVNLSLSNFYFGYVLSYINTLKFQDVITIFNITMEQQTARGVLNGLIPGGACVGCLLAKKLIHYFTRRQFILFVNAIAIVVGCLIFIQNQICFIIIRIIQGICIGLYTSTVSMTISEISPVEISGSVGAFTQIFASMGVAISYLFYYLLFISVPTDQQKNIWYYVFGFPLITIVLQSLLLLFVFPYETPKYFLMHHQKSKARDLIAELYLPEYVEQVLKQKIQDIQQLNKKQARKAARKNNPGVGSQVGRTESAASISSQLSGVEIPEPDTPGLAIFSSLHLHILRQFVGINVVVAYGGTIIQKSNPELRPIVPFILNFEAMFGAILSIYLLAKLGRKTILQIGTSGLTISLLLITIGFGMTKQNESASTILILIGLFSYMFIFGLALGTIVWLYIAEIAEPSIISIATTITWIFAAIVMVFFPIIKQGLPDKNPFALFLFFLLWTAASFIINQVVLIETKGKTEHQIQDEFRNSIIAKALCCGSNQVKNIVQLPNKTLVDHSSEHHINLTHPTETTGAIIQPK